MMFNVHLSDMLTRLSRVFAALCEMLSVQRRRLRHRDGTYRACRAPDDAAAEMDTRYKERPEGSVSKLNTYRDGFRILYTIGYLVREERPLMFFSVFAALFAVASLADRRAGGARNISAPGWCRVCPPRCWPPA